MLRYNFSPAAMTTISEPSASAPLLRHLLAAGVIADDDFEALAAVDRAALEQPQDDAALLTRLISLRLLTDYQASRIRTGRLHGLVLGNYRVLDRLGTGGMGIVYRGEHRRLRQSVAIKVLQLGPEYNPRTLARFFQEVRSVAQLRHPNIVAAIDAGEEPCSAVESPAVPYFVMELVPGADLERLVAQAALDVPFACHVIHQIADALLEAHRSGLIHRDIKPSNVIVAPDGQAKLLDFGLARLLGSTDERLTVTGAALGTVGFMAPEQARNARSADARADIFGLGCTLFYALTGQVPFTDPAAAATAPRPSAASLRRDVPTGLDAVLSRMMAATPEQRYPNAEAVMRALLPYLPTATAPTPAPSPTVWSEHSHSAGHASAVAASQDPAGHAALRTAEILPNRVLIVDDQADIRRLCRISLTNEGMVCDEAGTGPDAVEQAAKKPYDLVLLDVDLPGFSGEEVLKRLRRTPPSPHLKVVMFSGNASGDELSRILLAGADDFLTKPFSVVQLRARVKSALRLKDAQDRSAGLNRQLMALNAELEQSLQARDGELLRARNGLVLALAKLIEHRSTETGSHLQRIQRYCRVLAEEAAATPAFASLMDGHFIRLLEDAAPLHDIGKAALPDHILNKPGPLEPHERVIMQDHTTIGAETLLAVARQHPFATAFLHTAIDIARSHHEKWNGTGYPDRLSGEAIPVTARIVAIADVYDALRSKRIYKPGLSHTTTLLTMTEANSGHFDPALLNVFIHCAPQFDRIFREHGD